MWMRVKFLGRDCHPYRNRGGHDLSAQWKRHLARRQVLDRVFGFGQQGTIPSFRRVLRWCMQGGELGRSLGFLDAAGPARELVEHAPVVAICGSPGGRGALPSSPATRALPPDLVLAVALPERGGSPVAWPHGQACNTSRGQGGIEHPCARCSEVHLEGFVPLGIRVD